MHHVPTFASDHCLIALIIQKRGLPKPKRRRFFFEERWNRNERCKEIIERAWDPLKVSPDTHIQDRIKNCQTHLQRWNRDVFDNVSKILKQKQECLKQLETLNLLHEMEEEI